MFALWKRSFSTPAKIGKHILSHDLKTENQRIYGK